MTFYSKVVKILKKNGKISISMIQRELGISYRKAVNVINKMKRMGLVSDDKKSGICYIP